jgi:outer membrane protein
VAGFGAARPRWLRPVAHDRRSRIPMKTLMTSRLLLLLALLLLPFLDAGVASAQGRIAYVTSWRIIGPNAEYTGSREAEQALSRDIESWNREIKDREEEVRTIEKEIEQKRLILSESKRQELEQKRSQKVGEYDRRVKELYGEGGLIERRNFELTKPILDRVKEAVSFIARQEGYDFVFDASDANLVWANKDYDITQQVLERMEEISATTPGAIPGATPRITPPLGERGGTN